MHSIGVIMAEIMPIFFTSWILISTNSLVMVRASNLTLKQASNSAPLNGVILPPNPDDNSLWCLYCRSDKQPDCINKAAKHIQDFTKPCNVETFTAFHRDIENDNLERPAVAPRQGTNTQWVCFRMYTADETLTMRSCQIAEVGEIPFDKEVCGPCRAAGIAARCCKCAMANCNHQNSKATLVFQRIAILPLNIILLFVPYFLEI